MFWNVPGKQDLHKNDDDAYCPAAHMSQPDLVELTTLPFAHFLQVDPDSTYRPAGQSLQADLSELDLLPLGHVLQILSPYLLYCPASQS